MASNPYVLQPVDYSYKDDLFAGNEAFDQAQIDRFQDLLNKLESSKKRQQRQKSVEGRRDIFAGGLAGMMDNF